MRARRFIIVYALALASLPCVAQEHKSNDKAFWAAQGVFWASMAVDGIVSGRNHCLEANSMYRSHDGQFDRGRYFAINLPLSFGMTLASMQARKIPVFGRALSFLPAASGSTQHIRGALSWRKGGTR
jgi:hypothetical protein